MARGHGTIGKRLVCAGVLLLGACSRPVGARVYDPGAVHEDTGAFPVGEIGPFSGPQAAEALAFHRGFARALEECNGQGGAQGRHIELQVFDDRGRPADTRAGVQRLSGPNGAVAIGCSSGADCLKAAREAAGELPIVPGASGKTPEERGYSAGRRLVAACERAPKILPKEVAAELAAAAGRPYPRAP
jgi:ABC-type branched-subunit amino acid transport system substrate-binding protein